MLSVNGGMKLFTKSSWPHTFAPGRRKCMRYCSTIIQTQEAHRVQLWKSVITQRARRTGDPRYSHVVRRLLAVFQLLQK